MIISQSYTIRFLSRQELAKDTYSFYFERPKNFNFLPGQYNRWTLPITATDGRGSSRFFTISSSPFEMDKLTLTTKIIQSDFKKALLKLEPNDEIKIFGPMGNFVFDETNAKPRVFIAGGVGITPFHSMLQYAAAKNAPIPITLLASFSTPEEMIFLEELKKLETMHTHIKNVYGRISEELIKKYIPDITNSIFYVVGPPSMEEATKTLLNEMHITSENILTEQFTGY